MIRILTGDCRKVLATLPAESVQCCVTSPPYFGLRDYGTATWDGGDAGCDHLGEPFRTRASVNKNCGSGNDIKNALDRQPMGQTCSKCGARRIDAQIGLEPTPDAYVAEMVAVFRDVRRVLRADSVCFINIGDSYAGGGTMGRNDAGKDIGGRGGNKEGNPGAQGQRKAVTGLKPKDLIGIPWLLAFALRADGWYLRQEIIWHKPNPMPESVQDRCTKAHESVFLLTKSARYYFDAKAIAEESSGGTECINPDRPNNGQWPSGAGGRMGSVLNGRNKRSVWTIATQPYSGSHFATMPPELAETCIKAGTSEKGQCPHCGAPWVRVVDKPDNADAPRRGSAKSGVLSGKVAGIAYEAWRAENPTVTIGWSPSCTCPAHQPVPQMVLDPFGGAGTTALVADRLQRDATIIELNPAYAALARNRINGEAGLFSRVAAE